MVDIERRVVEEAVDPLLEGLEPINLAGVTIFSPRQLKEALRPVVGRYSPEADRGEPIAREVYQTAVDYLRAMGWEQDTTLVNGKRGWFVNYG